MNFPLSPIITSLLPASTFLSTLLTNTLSQYPSLHRTDQVSCTNKTTNKIIVLYILIFTLLDSKREDKTNGKQLLSLYLPQQRHYVTLCNIPYECYER